MELRLIYKDSYSLFEELFERSYFFKIHHRNFQKL